MKTTSAGLARYPGVLAYGETEQQARANVESLALRVIADRIEHGEPMLPKNTISLRNERADT